jgi:alpha-tubulin suppressor-like RCC1 family protein
MPAQVRAPSQVGAELDWRQIDTGQNSTCGVRADGSAYCWGSSDGFAAAYSSPTRMSGGATMVETDTFHWCALDAMGVVSCSGRNTEGQLADGTNVDRTTLAPTTPAMTFAQLAVGRFFSCAVTAAGVVYCAGENADGQLGVGDNSRRTALTPTR